MKLSSIIAFAIFGLTSAQWGCDVTKIICEHNRYRSAKGLKPLGLHQGLSKAALAHTTLMANHKSMEHQLNGESGLMNRIKVSNVQTSACAENIAEGYNDELSVCNDWYKSPGHYANIMNPSYNCAGAAHVNGYWTVDFAKSDCPPVKCDGSQSAPTIAPINNKVSNDKTYEPKTQPKYQAPQPEYHAPAIENEHEYDAPSYDTSPVNQYSAAPTYDSDVSPTSDHDYKRPHKRCRRRGHKKYEHNDH
jgi:hypothetical protein